MWIQALMLTLAVTCCAPARPAAAAAAQGDPAPALERGPPADFTSLHDAARDWDGTGELLLLP